MVRYDSPITWIRWRLIVFLQFVPGMCTITPLALGISSIRRARFILLNILGNFFWTATYLVFGHGAAAAWQQSSHSTPSWAIVIAVAIAVALAIHVTIRRVFRRDGDRSIR